MTPVEADISFESLSIVSKSPTTTRHDDETLGASLEKLDDRLRRSGLQLSVTAPNGYADKKLSDDGDEVPDVKRNDAAMISGQVLRCPQLIEFAITQAIDVGRATLGDVGVKILGNDERVATLTAGNVVALYNALSKCFLRVKFGVADLGGGQRDVTNLPLEEGSQRFLVVAAGRDRVAFFSPCDRRFLRMLDSVGRLGANGSPALHTRDRPRVDEIFEVAYLNRDVPVLYNSFYEKKGYLGTPHQYEQFEVVQIRGLDFPAERFRLAVADPEADERLRLAAVAERERRRLVAADAKTEAFFPEPVKNVCEELIRRYPTIDLGLTKKERVGKYST